MHIVFKEMKISFFLFLRVMFYLVGIFRTSSLGDSISSNLERTVLRRQGEESHYIEVFNKGQVG